MGDWFGPKWQKIEEPSPEETLHAHVGPERAAAMVASLAIALGMAQHMREKMFKPDPMASFVALAILFGSIPVRGFVITALWSWFVLPLWPTLPSLGLWQALGLSIFANYLTPPTESNIKHYDSKELIGWALSKTVGNALYTMGLAFIIMKLAGG